MEDVRWFDVDLHTLNLLPLQTQDWPESMRPVSSRMCEECLESLVALNLDTLFPDEHLLLTSVQEQMVAAADVTAVDPLGIVRMVELKKTEARTAELEDQVISYGIASAALSDWNHSLACGLTDLPERILLMAEAFRSDMRAKATSLQWFKRQLPSARFEGVSRFKAILNKASALRAARGLDPVVDPLQDPSIASICRKLYRRAASELAWGDPADLARQIGADHFSVPPIHGFTEFTMIAPGLGSRADAVDAALRLEKRRACFNLIEGDLRCLMTKRGVQRAVLRWKPVHRTISGRILRLLTALRNRLAEEGHGDAAGFLWDPKRERTSWRQIWGNYVDLTEGVDGKVSIETSAEWMTNGVSELKPKRKAALSELGARLGDLGIRRSGSELCAVLEHNDLLPAARLMYGYHTVLSKLGLGEPYRWHRRSRADDCEAGAAVD